MEILFDQETGGTSGGVLVNQLLWMEAVLTRECAGILTIINPLLNNSMKYRHIPVPFVLN